MGFTSNFSGLAQHVTGLLRAVTDAPVAFGGVDVTANPDVAIEHADIVCIGEGRRRRPRPHPPHDRRPALYRRPQPLGPHPRRPDPQERRPPPRDPPSTTSPSPISPPSTNTGVSGGVAHADRLHPDSHLMSSYPIMTTRGCPYACTFCCNSMLRDLYGNKDYVRTRSVDNVIAELRAYLDRNPPGPVDRNLGRRLRRQHELGRGIRRRLSRGHRPPLLVLHLPPRSSGPRLVESLKRAGIGFLVMGLQSGSQRILNDVYNRKVPNQKAIDAAKMITDAGVTLLVDLIDGYPFQTEQDNLDTLELMLAMPEGVILQEINPLSFFRNYPLVDKARELGIPVQMIPGRNTAVVQKSPEQEFWRAILTLSQFKSVPADEIRALATDPHMREHPELVKSIAKAMIDATYLPNTRMRRSEQIRELQEDNQRMHNELSRLRGSRLVRGALTLRGMLDRSGDGGDDLLTGNLTGLKPQERTARAITTATDNKRQSHADPSWS